MNLRKFLASLMDLYGARFTQVHPTCIDARGQIAPVWQAALANFGGDIFAAVINDILLDCTQFTGKVPSVPETRKLCATAQKRIEQKSQDANSRNAVAALEDCRKPLGVCDCGKDAYMLDDEQPICIVCLAKNSIKKMGKK